MSSRSKLRVDSTSSLKILFIVEEAEKEERESDKEKDALPT